jgi:hypothetical protein
MSRENQKINQEKSLSHTFSVEAHKYSNASTLSIFILPSFEINICKHNHLDKDNIFMYYIIFKFSWTVFSYRIFLNLFKNKNYIKDTISNP